MDANFQVALTRAYNAIINYITRKADKTGGVSQITDSNSANYTNMGSLSSNATQQTINNTINTKLGNCLTNVPSHNQNLSTITDVSTVAVNIVYEDDTTDTKYLVEYTGGS